MCHENEKNNKIVNLMDSEEVLNRWGNHPQDEDDNF
jgi:hypothetical protein